jgi:transposase
VVDAIVNVKITEHQSLALECPINGKQLIGEFPGDIKATIQYGEHLQSMVVALNTVGVVSVNRTHEILSGIWGIPLSTGTISNMVGKFADSVTGAVERIRHWLTESELINLDETGTRVDGKTMWVHNASNSDYTHLTINAKRGQVGMDAGGVLPDFTRIGVHDCWAPYWKYMHMLHALCCAHLLRELIGVIENHPDQTWANDFKRLLLEMKSAKEDAIKSESWQLSQDRLAEFSRLYDEIIARGLEENPVPEAPVSTEKKRGRPKKGKVLALIERLQSHKGSVCLFIHNFDVPFDNNQAERDCRMVKTKTKVSGCFRSLVGAENYLKIMSYVGTAKKHGFSAYEAIRLAMSGTPEFFFAQGC